MSEYRSILLSGLTDAGWEQVEVLDTSQWWAAEFWKIRSIKQNWGFELFLTFVVDPQADLQDGSPRRASAVWEVVASEDIPDNNSQISRLPSMPVRERNIHNHLEVFLSALDELRSGEAPRTKSAEQLGGGCCGDH